MSKERKQSTEAAVREIRRKTRRNETEPLASCTRSGFEPRVTHVDNPAHISREQGR